MAGDLSGLTESQKLRRQKIQASNNHAYSLLEVADMLEKLPEPARAVCAVAAFTGFTRSELKGVKWSDYDGEQISIQRKIWTGEVESPKTEAQEAGVFVIPLLRKILVKYKKAFPPGGDVGSLEARNSYCRWISIICRDETSPSISTALGSDGILFGVD